MPSSAGFIIGHVTPEAQEGGPIALVQNGDRIVIGVLIGIASVQGLRAKASKSHGLACLTGNDWRAWARFLDMLI